MERELWRTREMRRRRCLICLTPSASRTLYIFHGRMRHLSQEADSHAHVLAFSEYPVRDHENASASMLLKSGIPAHFLAAPGECAALSEMLFLFHGANPLRPRQRCRPPLAIARRRQIAFSTVRKWRSPRAARNETPD